MWDRHPNLPDLDKKQIHEGSRGWSWKGARDEKRDGKSDILKKTHLFCCPRQASASAMVATLSSSAIIADGPNLPNVQGKKCNKGNTLEKQEVNVRQGKKRQEERSVQRQSVRPNQSRSVVGMIKGKGYRKRTYKKLERWIDNKISFPSLPRCQLVDSLIILDALIKGF
nr:reverse transcriptase domain-containing protein [Tanacetum cinerariifolium]